MFTYHSLEVLAWIVDAAATASVLWRLFDTPEFRKRLFALRLPLGLIAGALMLGVYADKTHPPHVFWEPQRGGMV